MTLRKKTLLIIGLTLVILLAVFFLISSTVLLRGFEDIEAQETQQDVQRSIDSLDNDLASLENTTRDWAVWDDTYAFISEGDDDYIKTIESSFVNNRLNMMMFVDNSSNTVFAEAFDLAAEKNVPLPESWRSLLDDKMGLFSNPDSKDAVSGLVMLPEGPMLVAAHPILTSEGNGPAKGTVICGRYLDQAQVTRLAEIMHLSLAAYSLDDPSLPDDFRRAQLSIDEQNNYFVETLDSDAIAGYACPWQAQSRPKTHIQPTMRRA